MTTKHRVGSLFWISSIQYFVVQLLVAGQWENGFSVRRNTISDLGNTVCGLYDSRYVCSPWHNLMNASFILLGITMFLGAVYLSGLHKKKLGNRLGFIALALAGIGTVLVGLFPENTIGWLHGLGASLPFFVGNVGLVLLSTSLKVPKWLRRYTMLSGVVALCALSLFLSGTYVGLGFGGMERVTAYPQTIWLIVFGIYSLRYRSTKN